MERFVSKYANNESVFGEYEKKRLAQIKKELGEDVFVSADVAIGTAEFRYPVKVWGNAHLGHSCADRLSASADEIINRLCTAIEENEELSAFLAEECLLGQKVALMLDSCDAFYLYVEDETIRIGTVVICSTFYADNTAVWAYCPDRHTLVTDRDKIPCMKVSAETKYRGGYHAEYRGWD